MSRKDDISDTWLVTRGHSKARLRAEEMTDVELEDRIEGINEHISRIKHMNPAEWRIELIQSRQMLLINEQRKRKLDKVKHLFKITDNNEHTRGKKSED